MSGLLLPTVIQLNPVQTSNYGVFLENMGGTAPTCVHQTKILFDKIADFLLRSIIPIITIAGKHSGFQDSYNLDHSKQFIQRLVNIY